MHILKEMRVIDYASFVVVFAHIFLEDMLLKFGQSFGSDKIVIWMKF